MIEFINPSWLWGLSGLSIPIAIHLLSRKEGKVIPIGSLRHLRESDTAQFSSLRLNEILLLLLRSLLIVLLVMLLAGLRIKSTGSSGEKWLVIEKGIDTEKALASFLDSLSAQGYETHFLSTDFPKASDATQVTVPEDYWALAETLGEKSGYDVIVISYNYLNAFKGERSPLPPNVRWITHEPSPQSFYAKAVAISTDSLWVRNGKTSASETSFESREIVRPQGQKYFKGTPTDEAIAIENSDTIPITIYSDDKFGYDLKVLQATLAAIQETIPYKIITTSKKIKDFSQGNSQWIFWLSGEKFPEVNFKSSVVYTACLGDAQPIVVSGIQANHYCNEMGNTGWIITKRLTEESALNNNLALKIAAIILSDRRGSIDGKEKKTLPSEAMWSVRQGVSNNSLNDLQTINTFLVIALLLTLLSERLLAFNRNQ